MIESFFLNHNKKSKQLFVIVLLSFCFYLNDVFADNLTTIHCEGKVNKSIEYRGDDTLHPFGSFKILQEIKYSKDKLKYINTNILGEVELIIERELSIYESTKDKTLFIPDDNFIDYSFQLTKSITNKSKLKISITILKKPEYRFYSRIKIEIDRKTGLYEMIYNISNDSNKVSRTQYVAAGNCKKNLDNKF